MKDTFTSHCTACGHDYDGPTACPKCGQFKGLYNSGGLNVTPRVMPEGIRVFKDGNAFCAVHGDFINLQESPAGFGHNTVAAIEDLQKQPATIESHGQMIQVGSQVAYVYGFELCVSTVERINHPSLLMANGNWVHFADVAATDGNYA